MKPLKLTIRGLRSYGAAEPVEIDFQGKNTVGVIGPTGAGKSSLLEAVSLALFKQSSWSASEVASLIAHGAGSMAVELTFLHNDQRWTVHRAFYATRRPSLHKLSCAETGEEIDSERKVNERIEQLLGVNADAFHRVALLHQGRFDRLLIASKAERGTLLNQLLGIDELESAREIAGEQLRSLNEALTQGRLARAAMPDDPELAAEQARTQAESHTQRASLLGRTHANLRELQTTRATVQTLRTAVGEARHAVDTVETASQTGRLADLASAHQELCARERDLSARSKQVVEQATEAEIGIDRLRAQGLTEQSIGQAEPTIAQLPATIEQLRARRKELDGRIRQAAQDRERLTEQTAMLGELAAQESECAAHAETIRAKATDAANRVDSVGRAIEELRHRTENRNSLRTNAQRAAEEHRALAREANEADTRVLAGQHARDNAVARLRDTQEFEAAEQSMQNLDNAVVDALSTGHTASRFAAEAFELAANVEEIAQKVEAEQHAADEAIRETGPLSQRIAALDHAVEELDESADSLKDTAVRCLEAVADQHRHTSELAQAHSALLQAEERLNTARDEFEAARSAEDLARSAHEHLQHTAMAATLAHNLQPGDPCPVCAQDVPEPFIVPSHAADADIDRARTAVTGAQSKLASCQTIHATAEAQIATARQAVKRLEAAAREAQTRWTDELETAIQLYTRAAAVLTAVGFAPGDGADGLRRAVEDHAAAFGAEPGPAAPPRAAAHQLLEPLRRAQLQAEGELEDKRGWAAELRATAAGTAKALAVLTTESNKARKQADSAARKAATARTNAAESITALENSYDRACAAVHQLTGTLPPGAFPALVGEMESAIAAAGSAPTTRTAWRARASFEQFNAMRAALDSAGADHKARQAEANELNAAFAAAGAEAEAKHEAAQRARETSNRLSGDAEAARSECAEALTALAAAFTQAQAALVHAGFPIATAPEALASAAAHAVETDSSISSYPTREELTREIDQAAAAAGRSAQEAERKAAELATKLEVHRTNLRATEEGTEKQERRNQGDAEALEADQRRHHEAIAALPRRYRSMLPASTEQLTADHAERIQRELAKDANDLQLLLGQRDTAREAAETVSHELATLSETRKAQIEHPLADVYEQLTAQRTEIDAQLARARTTEQPAGPTPLAVAQRTIDTVTGYATDLAQHRSRASQLLGKTETELTDHLRDLESRLNEAGTALANIDGFETEHDPRDPEQLDRLTAAAAVAAQAATDARARHAAALAQIPHAAALDRAIGDAGKRGATLEDLRKLLRKDGFPAYLTMRRTEALLTVATVLFDTLSSGRFGFAPDFLIVEHAVGSVREARTLSGGEKFLASLALALAMVELYSRGGPRLASLFLDEGFASLDEDSLDVALDVVRRQAGGDRLVVLISHLRAVAQAVDDVLLVERAASGSTARWLTDDERDAILDDELRAGLLTTA